MPDSQETFADAIIRLWGQKPEAASGERPPSYDFDDSKPPGEVLERLRQEFGEPQVAAHVEGVLSSTIAVFAQGRVPDPRQRFVATACLRLASMEGGVTIPAPLARDVVSYFDAGYWYLGVRKLIERYLTDADVLEAIEKVLLPGTLPGLTFAGLEGLRLYQGVARREEPRGRFEKAAARVAARVRELTRSPDPMLREAAYRSLRWVEQYLPDARAR